MGRLPTCSGRRATFRWGGGGGRPSAAPELRGTGSAGFRPAVEDVGIETGDGRRLGGVRSGYGRLPGSIADELPAGIAQRGPIAETCQRPMERHTSQGVEEKRVHKATRFQSTEAMHAEERLDCLRIVIRKGEESELGSLGRRLRAVGISGETETRCVEISFDRACMARRSVAHVEFDAKPGAAVASAEIENDPVHEIAKGPDERLVLASGDERKTCKHRGLSRVTVTKVGAPGRRGRTTIDVRIHSADLVSASTSF